MILFDHMKLIAGDPKEMKKFRTWLLGGQGDAGVAHENDASCCIREGWSQTFNRVHKAISPPREVIPINIDHTPDGSVMKADIAAVSKKESK